MKGQKKSTNIIIPSRWTIRLRDRLADQTGATTAEYAVIIVAIVLTVIVTILFLQDQTTTAFNHVGNKAAQFGTIE